MAFCKPQLTQAYFQVLYIPRVLRINLFKRMKYIYMFCNRGEMIVIFSYGTTSSPNRVKPNTCTIKLVFVGSLLRTQH